MLKAIRNLLSSKSDPTDAPDYKPALKDVLNRDWFELWYQPKIELRSMRLIGAEALARARHPKRGIIPPGVFLPGASEEDVLQLTERVILTALRDWELFEQNGISMKFAVNVPVTAFVKLPLAKMLHEERPKSDAWPGMILEVTE